MRAISLMILGEKNPVKLLLKSEKQGEMKSGEMWMLAGNARRAKLWRDNGESPISEFFFYMKKSNLLVC